LAFQEQIRLRTNPNGEKLFNTLSPNQMPGIVLAAAGPSELAAEAQWNGFSAGLFTYALTQHLWQASPATTIQISLSRAAGMVNQMVGTEQQPRVIQQKSQQNSLLAYYLPPDPSIGADGVVTAIEESGRTAQLWLAGLPATVLEYYGSNSLVSLYPNGSLPSVAGEGGQESSPVSTPAPASTQIRSKEGLTARARIVGISVTDNSPLKVGQLVHEAVRLLPRNIGLTIALDVSLERIERVDATSAFAAIPPVSSVVIAGEQPADYVFGKVPLSPAAAPVAANVPADVAATRPEGMDALGRTAGYGLFYLGREPIRNTTGEAGEAVRSAVNRLTPKLETLLAAKLLRLTVNEGSSRLGIRASLEMVSPQGTVVMQRETSRASSLSSSPAKAFGDNKKTNEFIAKVGEGNLPTVPIGSQIQYRLENYSDRPIYFMLLGMDTSGNAIALYHNQASQGPEDAENKPPLKNAVIAPGETLTLPQSSASNWVIQEPPGLAEIQLICSRTPFTKSLMALDSARRKREGERIGDLFNPLEVARSVLQDLHNASAVAPELIGTTSDSYALDVNAWATLSFIYQVV
jgi:hypothetical protein